MSDSLQAILEHKESVIWLVASVSVGIASVICIVMMLARHTRKD